MKSDFRERLKASILLAISTVGPLDLSRWLGFEFVETLKVLIA